MSDEALLASWNDTPTRKAIVDFVAAVTTEGSDQLVPPEQRIATFDNDGTLWSEKPMQVQLDFMVQRFSEMAEADPSLRDEQPYKSAYEHDVAWLSGAIQKHYHGDDSDLALLEKALPTAYAGLSVDEFAAKVSAFFAEAAHPVLKRSYDTIGFAPMVELLRYLEANGFTVYIASGGDRDFMRPVAGSMYEVPPERVIGSSLTLDYQEREAGNDVLYKSTMEFFDDGPTKPIRIWSRVGRRPIMAVGNSNGDREMLRFAGSAGGPALRMLVRHTDGDREFAYDDGAEDALSEAASAGWTVIDMQADWSRIFVD